MTAPTISVTMTRTGMTPSTTLSIAQDFTATYWIAADAIEWPKFGRRKTRGTPSPYLSGPGTLLARVSDLGTLSLPIYAKGSTTSALEAAKVYLQATVDQWSYTLTLTVDGTSKAFTAECVDDDIAWGPIDPGMVGAKIAHGTVVIPLYPV